MEIPISMLDQETLEKVIEEFVTRDGTDLVDASHKIKQIKKLLEEKKAVLTFDLESKSCHIEVKI